MQHDFVRMYLQLNYNIIKLKLQVTSYIIYFFHDIRFLCAI